MNPPLSLHATPAASPAGNAPDSLFERFGWFYAFLRVRVFRDDTEAIARILQLATEPTNSPAVPVLVELGCGPGFYACQLAGRFPGWTILGVDRSHEQLRRASEAARRSGLRNCTFEWNDASALQRADASVDGVFASRLFTVIEADKLTAVLSEMHRVLRPDGRCFIAEPRSRWRAAIPLKLLWLLARFASGWPRRHLVFGEPQKPTVLNAEELKPWWPRSPGRRFAAGKMVTTSMPWFENTQAQALPFPMAMLAERIPVHKMAGFGLMQESGWFQYPAGTDDALHAAGVAGPQPTFGAAECAEQIGVLLPGDPGGR